MKAKDIKIGQKVKYEYKKDRRTFKYKLEIECFYVNDIIEDGEMIILVDNINYRLFIVSPDTELELI